MQAAGNDYIYVDTRLYEIDNPQEAARLWSNRHKGIGSDGLVLIGSSPVPDADFSMRIFNADGSEALMCGNACRCIGKYLYDKGLTKKTHIRLHTLSGIRLLELKVGGGNTVEAVTVDMGVPQFENPRQFLPGIEALPEGTFVGMGNPHFVIFTDDVNAVGTLGRKLEHHPAFPERANIELADMRGDGIRVRVWERGSGITMACGTGACAVAVAAHRTGRTGRTSRIAMDGGVLDVEWRAADGRVCLSGPAEFVFEGEVEMPSYLDIAQPSFKPL